MPKSEYNVSIETNHRGDRTPWKQRLSPAGVTGRKGKVMKVQVKVAYDKYSKGKLVELLQERDSLIEELQTELRIIKVKKPFIVALIAGDVSLNDLNDFVKYWHTHDTGNGLREFLGLTQEEYAQWCRSSSDATWLHQILAARQEG